MSTTPSPQRDRTSGVFPTMLFSHGDEQRNIILNHTPFTVGRKVDRDLVFSDPRVSREHAKIVFEGDAFHVIDEGSKHGTFVNGQRVERSKLERGDRVEFGAPEAGFLIFHPLRNTSNTARDFLKQLPEMHISNEASDLEKLVMFLEAARKLNTTGVLDEILVTLLDATLRLTKAERGYVFLRDGTGVFGLVAGRNSQGEPLLDDKTISHSALEEAIRSNSDYLVTDTSQSVGLAVRQSIVAFDLRTVICIPLRKPQVKATRSEGEPGDAASTEVIGALYVDSRFASRDIGTVSQDILRAIATEAASLIENARLVQAEESSRRYQQELSIAASIQQRLMAVTIPEVPFAKLRGRNLSCKEIGGDFFDAVNTPEGLVAILADVSGKGVAAALLASIMQGMIYSHLGSGMPLTEVVTAVNRFFTQKQIGEKYATMIVARLGPDGDVEFVNCGHILPLIISNGKVERPSHGNVPVGLLPDITYESDRCHLQPGDRIMFVTDGVTEAENAMGEFFDNPRLEEVAATSKSLEDILAAVSDFCAGTPLNDDCTVVELIYTGPPA